MLETINLQDNNNLVIAMLKEFAIARLVETFFVSEKSIKTLWLKASDG